MPTACLRLFTFPPLPDLRSPCLYSLITLWTFFCPEPVVFFGTIFPPCWIPFEDLCFARLRQTHTSGSHLRPGKGRIQESNHQILHELGSVLAVRHNDVTRFP